MTRLTAKQASDITDANSAMSDVDEILKRIEEQARKGNRSIIVRDYQFGTGECYDLEVNYPERCKFILKAIRDLGYSTKIRVEERQFVDVWLEISW